MCNGLTEEIGGVTFSPMSNMNIYVKDVQMTILLPFHARADHLGR